MRNFLLSISILLGSLGACFEGKAQIDSGMEVFFNLNYAMFDKHIKHNLIQDYGYGIQLGYLYNPIKNGNRNFIEIGFDIGYSFAGNYKETIDNGESVKIKSGIIPFNLITRLRTPIGGKIQPYLDLIGGLNSFKVKVKVDDAVWAWNKTVLINHNKESFSYGAGLGLTFLMNEETGLSIGARYIRGAKLDFSEVKEFQQNDNGDYFFPNKLMNTTDVLYLHLAVIYFL